MPTKVSFYYESSSFLFSASNSASLKTLATLKSRDMQLAELAQIAVTWPGRPTGANAPWYEVHGFPEAVAMLEAEPGPELPLASGNGWAISISERGPGFCTRTSAANSFGEGCFVPSQMTIPGVLGLDMSMLYEEDQPKSGTVLGIVTERTDEIVIRFSTGIERQLTPGHIAQFGYRGFGLLYDATAIGLPVEVELFDGDLSVAIYAITEFDDVARRTR